MLSRSARLYLLAWAAFLVALAVEKTDAFETFPLSPEALAAALVPPDSCPRILLEPTRDYEEWWRRNCCVPCGFGIPCNFRPGFRETLVTVHHLAHVGPSPDITVVGFLWLPPATGTWVVRREVFVYGALQAVWQWSEQLTYTCEQPPLFIDGFESGDTSRWSRTRPDPLVFIFGNGFESGDTSRWSRAAP